jgi:anti-sigma B factor antagonist
VRLQGRFVHNTDSRQVEWKIQELLSEERRNIVLDLSGLTHIDSTGIGILVMCSGKAKFEGGDLRIAGAAGPVDEILHITKVSEIIDMYASVDEALQVVRAQSA